MTNRKRIAVHVRPKTDTHSKEISVSVRESGEENRIYWLILGVVMIILLILMIYSVNISKKTIPHPVETSSAVTETLPER